jgi:hypothetical protein
MEFPFTFIKRVAAPLFPNLNRFFAAIIVGTVIYLLLTVVIVAISWNGLHGNKDSGLLAELAPNLVSDAILLLLVGFFGLWAQFDGNKGDVLRQRIRNLFSNTQISHSVMEFFEGVVQQNCVYAELAEHNITVLEFRPDISAYRVEHHNKYVLRNAIGDVSHSSGFDIEIEPDIKRDIGQKVCELIEISLACEGVRRRIQESAEILSEGFRKRVELELGPGAVCTLETKWWSWVDVNDGDSGYSLKRFSEKFLVRLINKANVRVRFGRVRGGTLVELGYDNQELLYEVHNLLPRERMEFFWAPPVETNS